MMEQTYQVIVVGGTPGGIAAAVAAARLGCSVALLEISGHLGGMTAGGLSTTDLIRRTGFGGLMNEFLQGVYRYYVETYGPDSEQVQRSKGGLWFEPSVAERVLTALVQQEPGIQLFRRHRLENVTVESSAPVALTARDLDGGVLQPFRGSIFIDATYEGDLAAMAGAPYRVGREGRAEHDEEFAGRIFWDWRRLRFLPESTHEADPGIQAYCFRACLTDDPANRVPIEKPAGYAEHLPDFRELLDDFAAGRVRGVRDIVPLSALYDPVSHQLTARTPLGLPNRKFQANGYIEALTSVNLPGASHRYPEAGWEERERITEWHRGHALGLLYFLQNDPAVPATVREELSAYGLPRDEYPDTGHFPFQLYVRQGRRILGDHLMTEHDLRIAPGSQRPPVHTDSIAVADHSFDVHPCYPRRTALARSPEGDLYLEGTLWFPQKEKGPAQPAQAPYRAILPQKVEQLLIPVPMSSTHIAFSALRMEPVWMATGQAAGTAAALALQAGVPVRQLDVARLQEALVRQGQVLTYFEDLKLEEDDFSTLQLQGTQEGWTSYRARGRG
jgi:hypothetical protein